ncbi:hypothetical protein IMCC3317_38610 [Kordia antarctica]|uniref:SH3b domain-containing protein n=1 Tax=Kordia antarctica TaxID=1218801 RepID=A0A7L4ZP02_9FLAO|nr:SH3 domain-containing protein [Kordia antarctica]QHI38468.1 hypothetical protein IMCC3317_38610 [Kordia antarctica]
MKINSLTSKFSMFFAVIFLISCGDKTKQENPETTTETTSEASDTTAETPKEDTTYYSWVDNINVRDASNTKGKVVGTYSAEDALEFTGVKSDHKDIITLRGVAYNDNWLKITTKDNKEGWVFGGAVKHEDEIKGNGIITNEKFDFPHFGSFDLNSWTDLGVTKTQGGDAETSTYRYMKDNQILEIEKTDVGEYGYYYTYRLMDAKNTLQKERKFSFEAGMGDTGTMMELTEVVKNFTNKKQYARKQMLTKHFMQLNARPEMVNGNWEETALIDESKIAFAKPLQIISDFVSLPKEVDIDSGCSCTFRTHPKDYETVIFFSTIEEAPKAFAAIRIDGKNILLKSKKVKNPDYKRGDYHAHYYNDTYDLKIIAFRNGEPETESQEYAGTMQLTSKDGTVHIDINTFGVCGC